MKYIRFDNEIVVMMDTPDSPHHHKDILGRYTLQADITILRFYHAVFVNMSIDPRMLKLVCIKDRFGRGSYPSLHEIMQERFASYRLDNDTETIIIDDEQDVVMFHLLYADHAFAVYGGN